MCFFLGGYLNFIVVRANNYKMPVLNYFFQKKKINSRTHKTYYKLQDVKFEKLCDRYALIIPYKENGTKYVMFSIGDMLVILGLWNFMNYILLS